MQLKGDLFHLNLSVHHLLSQVSVSGHSQNISLLYQCKEEVISLYKDWEDAHEKVSEADRKYLKLSCAEAVHKCMNDVMINKKPVKKRMERKLHSEDFELQDKLTRLQKMLDDLKDKIVTKDVKNKTNVRPITIPATRWRYLVPKLSIISSLSIMLVLSLSWLATPQCCDYQAPWALWAHRPGHHPV